MESVEEIKLLVVDDHPVVRRGLVDILGTHPAMQVVGEASCGRDAVLQFDLVEPDVVLMDLRLPGPIDGVAAIEAIRERDSSARLLIVTAVDGEEDIFRGLRAGAQGYVLKDAPDHELVDAVLATMQGRRYLARAVAEKLANHLDSHELSQRELEILVFMSRGLSNKGIAKDAGITEGTVKFHVNNILSKLKCASRTEAVACAVRRGLVQIH